MCKINPEKDVKSVQCIMENIYKFNITVDIQNLVVPSQCEGEVIIFLKNCPLSLLTTYLIVNML